MNIFFTCCGDFNRFKFLQQSRSSETAVEEMVIETEEMENDNSLVCPSTSAPLTKKKTRTNLAADLLQI